MRNQHWIGRWKDEHGQEYALPFVSFHHEGIARITFQLLFQDLGQPVPHEFTVTLAETDAGDRRFPQECLRLY